jgi:hypothetical protein
VIKQLKKLLQGVKKQKRLPTVRPYTVDLPNDPPWM